MLRRQYPRHPTRNVRRALPVVLIAAGALLAGCNESIGPEPPVRYVVEVSGETFVVEVTSLEQVLQMEERLSSGQEGVLSGELATGDAGYNEPWSWHMVPSSVHTADMAIEVCDGRPSMVEEALEYWIGTVERFCPWGATVVERLP